MRGGYGDSLTLTTRLRKVGNQVVNFEEDIAMHTALAGASIPEATHHRVHVNGTDLHYVEAGSDGSPVLLVHGFHESWWTFRGVIPRLAESHRVFAVDLRGFGDSANDAETFDSATSADDLRLLIDHLDAGPVHLTGQDIAGATTFRLAATSQGSVRSYTAIEAALPGFGGEVLADVTKGGAWYIGALISPGVAELLFAGREREFLADYLFPFYGAVPPAVTQTDTDEFVRTYARPNGFNGAIGLYRSLLEDGDTIQALAAERPLHMPLMAIGAAAGEFTHATMTAAAGADVRSVLLDGVGHYAALEAPDKVADALLDFFATIDAA
jgi:pimeloyl-ACP methyl ester carboxylesterase